MDQSEPNTPDVSPAALERAARLFASDLRTLRERRQVPLSEVQRQTRISQGILMEFEATGLVTNQLFNRVYLRSLVVAYARTIGVDEPEVLQALDSTLSGEYDGRLAREDVGGIGRETSEASAQETHGAPAAPEPEVQAEPRHRLTDHFEFEESEDPNASQKEVSETGETSPRRHTEISTAIHDFVPPEQQKGVIVRPNRFRTVALAVLVVAFSVWAIMTAIRLSDRSVSGGSPAESSRVATERLVQTLPPDPIPLAPPIVIGDTIQVAILASQGPLDPVRVQLDADLRRPYWADQGDSLVFPMQQRIIIQDRLDSLSVHVEGIPYDLTAFAGRDRIVITRDSVESFVRSLESR